MHIAVILQIMIQTGRQRYAFVADDADLAVLIADLIVVFSIFRRGKRKGEPVIVAFAEDAADDAAHFRDDIFLIISVLDVIMAVLILERVHIHLSMVIEPVFIGGQLKRFPRRNKRLIALAAIDPDLAHRGIGALSLGIAGHIDPDHPICQWLFKGIGVAVFLRRVHLGLCDPRKMHAVHAAIQRIRILRAILRHADVDGRDVIVAHQIDIDILRIVFPAPCGAVLSIYRQLSEAAVGRRARRLAISDVQWIIGILCRCLRRFIIGILRAKDLQFIDVNAWIRGIICHDDLYVFYCPRSEFIGLSFTGLRLITVFAADQIIREAVIADVDFIMIITGTAVIRDDRDAGYIIISLQVDQQFSRIHTSIPVSAQITVNGSFSLTAAGVRRFV